MFKQIILAISITLYLFLTLLFYHSIDTRIRSNCEQIEKMWVERERGKFPRVIVENGTVYVTKGEIVIEERRKKK